MLSLPPRTLAKGLEAHETSRGVGRSSLKGSSAIIKKGKPPESVNPGIPQKYPQNTPKQSETK
eukprot:3759679-Amphidinium_carterae.1